MLNSVTEINDIAGSLDGEIGQNKLLSNAKDCKNYFTRVRIMLSILICLLSSFKSSKASRERKLGCSTKVTV